MKRILLSVTGVLLFVSIVLTVGWLSRSKTANSGELGFEAAIAKIKNKEIKEAVIKQDSLELTNKSNEKFTVRLDSSDAAREKIYEAANETGTEIRLEPASSGWGRGIWAVYLPFYLMWALTLAVIVYAVRTLSRNKG